MKRIMFVVLAMVLMASLVFSADLNLKATWTPNTETDLASYKLYRTDGTRTLLGTIPSTQVQPYLFVVTVADGTEGTLKFVLTALDTTGNESGDSNTANYPFDKKAPAAPGVFGVSKQ